MSLPSPQRRRLLALGAGTAGLVGGGLALVLMAGVSSSGFTDAAGPAGWILITLVLALGAIGATIVTYTTLGWCGLGRKRAG